MPLSLLRAMKHNRTMRVTPRDGCRLFFVFILTAAVLPQSPADSGPSAPLPSSPEAVTLQAIVGEHGSELAQIRSDTEALSLYRNRLSQVLGLQDTLPLVGRARPGTRRAQSIAPPDLREPATRLASELAAWHMAMRLREEAEDTSGDGLRELLDTTAAQQQWLSKRDERDTLNRAIALARVASFFQVEDARKDGVPVAYSRLAEHLDQAYPELTRGKASWLAVAVEQGTAGIEGRQSRQPGGDPWTVAPPTP